MNHDSLDGIGSASASHIQYEPSVSSSDLSSQPSIFSDHLSAHSSIATSISDDFRSSHDDARDRDSLCAEVQLQSQAQHGLLSHEEHSAVNEYLKLNGVAPPSYAEVIAVPPHQRQHPRRSSLSKVQKPPALVRQRDRKLNFVDNLVGKPNHSPSPAWTSIPRELVHVS